MSDGRGVPLAVTVTPGQRHECTEFESTMNAVRIPPPRGRPRTRPHRLAGDKGYSSRAIRRWLRQHRIGAVIPRRSDQRGADYLPLDREAYRQRNVVERCIGWLKECRRLLTRFEKLAVNFIGMVTIGMIERYFRILFSDRA